MALNVLGMGLLGAIGGGAQGFQQGLAEQGKDDDRKELFKHQDEMQQRMLDSKHDIANAQIEAKSQAHQEYERYKEQLQNQMLGYKRDHDKDVNDLTQQKIDLAGQTQQARTEASQARLDLASQRLSGAQDSAANRDADRQQMRQDKEDASNQAVVGNAEKQAEGEFNVIQKIKDSDEKAKAYGRYNIDPADPNADSMLQTQILQAKYSSMPKRAQEYAAKQGVDLAPANSTWAAKKGIQFDWQDGHSPPPPARGQAAPATSTPVKPTTAIPPAALDFLKQNAQDPNTLQAFQQKYGVDPTQYLQQ